MSEKKYSREYEQVVREHQFAQKSWNSAEGIQKPLTKLFLTLLVCFLISVIGFVEVHYYQVNFTIVVITFGVFIGSLILINSDISGAFTRFWISFRNYQDCKEFEVSSHINCSFLREFKEILFVSDNKILKGIGIFKIKKIPISLQGSKERLIRSLYDQQVPFFVSQLGAPKDTEPFIKNYTSTQSHGLTLETQFIFPAESERPSEDKDTTYKPLPPQVQEAQWEARGGPWDGRFLIGSCRSLAVDRDTELARMVLYRQLLTDLLKIRDVFQNEYPHTELEPLCGKELVAALRLLVTGAAQPSWQLTGEELVHHYLQVPQIVRKSMNHHYPAEFITPTNAQFDLEIGRAFETEFQKAQTPTGLRLDDMQQGILAVGGTAEQRFELNTKLVQQYVNQGGTYIIITKNKNWRRLLDLCSDACVLRLDEDIRLNPMDPEGTDLIVYSYLLTQVFAQTFNLARGAYQQLLDLVTICLSGPVAADLTTLKSKLTDQLSEPHADNFRELKTIHRFLLNSSRGKLGKVLGSTSFTFNEIIEQNSLTILEIDVKAQISSQFIVLCMLAKILAHGLNNPNQKCTVLVDQADHLAPLDPQYYKARELEPYFLDWVYRFHEDKLGLHLNLQNPSRVPPIILNSFKTILAYKITSFENLRIVRDLLQLFDDRVVHSRNRHHNHQVEYLQTLPNNQLLMKRADLTNTYPVQISPLDFANTHIWTPEELRARLKLTFHWEPPKQGPRTVLERDFDSDVLVVQDLLYTLSDYPEVSTRGILASLNANPSNDLDLNQLEYLLRRLVTLNYLVRTEWGEGRHTHRSYGISVKGSQCYDAYIKDIAKRSQESSIELNLESQ